MLVDIFGSSCIESDLTLLPTFLESERAVSAILSESLTEREKNTIMRERLRGDQNAKKRLIINETAENFLIRSQENLKRVFEIYCSLGEPMNTEKLKSAKALKLFKDCILVRTKEQDKILELSDERVWRYKRIVPLSAA